MSDPDLRQRAREVFELIFGPVADWEKELRSAESVKDLDGIDAALRAVQQETEQRMNVQRALAWDETAKRIEAIDTLTEERDEYKTKLRERVEQLAPGPQSSMGQPTVYLADVLALLPPVEPLTQADIARKEEWEGRS